MVILGMCLNRSSNNFTVCKSWSLDIESQSSCYFYLLKGKLHQFISLVFQCCSQFFDWFCFFFPFYDSFSLTSNHCASIPVSMLLRIQKFDPTILGKDEFHRARAKLCIMVENIWTIALSTTEDDSSIIIYSLDVRALELKPQWVLT